MQNLPKRASLIAAVFRLMSLRRLVHRTLCLDSRQRSHFSKTHLATSSQFDVFISPTRLPLKLFIRHLTNDFCWGSEQHGSRWAVEPAFDKRRSANDGFCANVRQVHHHSVNANQAVPSYGATMQNRAMSYMAVLLKNTRLQWKTVQHAVVLHITKVVDLYSAKVPPQTRIGANVTMFTNDHIPNDGGIRVNKARWIDNRDVLLDGKYWHLVFLNVVSLRLGDSWQMIKS
jgi:hypothetical protein